MARHGDSSGTDGMTGAQCYALVERLYPLCRSITGDGVRATLDIIGEQIPLQRFEVASGTRVFDWTVPPEWNIRDAYVKNTRGERVIDFQRSNLHVVSYSVPVRARMSRTELDAHLHSIPEHPDWIPYRTAYYEPAWGFCLSHNQRLSLADETYEVVIDSTLENGSLSYAECFLPGSSEREFLVYTHVCHPSLCNDNLSGIAVVVALVRHLMSAPRHYSYRFVFGPGTIGSITWLSRNEPVVERVDGGLVLSLLGDAGPLTYKASRRGDSVIDEVVDYVLGQRAPSARRIDFEPYGYDERQFCSPGFNLPMGRLTRTPNGQYPQYHTSADDLGFVSAQALGESLDVCRSIVETFDANRYYRNRLPKCEPQLGRRGLYAPMGGGQSTPHRQMAMLWLLNLCDGEHSLLDVARRSGIDFAHLLPVRDELIAAELLDEVPAPGGARS